MNKTAPILVAAVSMATGCSRPGIKGDGVIKTETRSISDYSEVEVVGGYQVAWSKGEPGLSLSADQNLLPLINTVVSGKTLRIDSKEDLAPTKSITITLSSSSLTAVELTGGIGFKASQISGERFKVVATGASNITVDGTAATLDANLTGASKLDAKSLQTQKATLSLVGASDAEIAVSDSLKVTITGAGSLTYSGNPKSVEPRITGAGTLRRQP